MFTEESLLFTLEDSIVDEGFFERGIMISIPCNSVSSQNLKVKIERNSFVAVNQRQRTL